MNVLWLVLGIPAVVALAAAVALWSLWRNLP